MQDIDSIKTIAEAPIPAPPPPPIPTSAPTYDSIDHRSRGRPSKVFKIPSHSRPDLKEFKTKASKSISTFNNSALLKTDIQLKTLR
jgi:hypothetical protein